MFRDLLDKFVDRKPELGLFRQMLGGETRQRLLLILDGPEKGKTWFIWRLFQECQDGGVPVVHLDFDQRRSGLAGDWLSVADEVCTALGDQHTPHTRDCAARLAGLSALQDLLAGGSTPGVSFGQGNDFTGADIRNIAGGNIVQIRTLLAGALTPAQAAQQQGALSRALRDDLAALGRAVLLIDTFERAPEDTRIWLERWVFRSLGRELPQTLVVVAGRPECRPFFQQPRPWSGLIAALDCLSSFSDKEIVTYYERCGLVVSDHEVALLAIARLSPGLMAQLGDRLAQARGGAR